MLYLLCAYHFALMLSFKGPFSAAFIWLFKQASKVSACNLNACIPKGKAWNKKGIVAWKTQKKKADCFLFAPHTHFQAGTVAITDKL